MSADGFALKSGKIDNKQKSRLSTVVQGSGTISFMLKVSSEYDAETGEAYDGLVIAVDGNDVTEVIGGELDWRRMSFFVDGDGRHTIEWRYEKDKRDDDGADCAWLDEVVWTPTVTANVAVPTEKGEIAATDDGVYRVTAAAGVTLTEDDIVFGAVAKEAYTVKIADDGKSATVTLNAPAFGAAVELDESEAQKDESDPSGALVAVDDDKIVAKPTDDEAVLGALPVKTYEGLTYQAAWGDDLEHLTQGTKVDGTGGTIYLGVIRQTGSKGFYKLTVSEQ